MKVLCTEMYTDRNVSGADESKGLQDATEEFMGLLIMTEKRIYIIVKRNDNAKRNRVT